jgi:hypothetical protein
MQYVQSLPPIYTPTGPTGTVVEAQAVPAVEPVTPRNMAQIPMRLDTERPALEQAWEPRIFASLDNDRRRVCRRIQHNAVMQELRSGVDRRRHNQRSSDLTTSVDENI